MPPSGRISADVLLVSVNQAMTPVPVMPFGACIVAEAAEQAGYRARLLDLMFRKDPAAALAGELARSHPAVIGLSLRNIDNNDFLHPAAYYRALEPLAAVIRKNSSALTVLGGAAANIMPEELLRFSGFHYVAVGNGEGSFPRLLSSLTQGRDARAVPGIGWFDRGVFRTSPAPACPGGDLPVLMPDFYRWLDMASYRARFAAVPLQSKRGCPFRCVYCTYGITEGRMYRLCRPEEIAETVERFAARGYPDIEFVDNVFNAPLEHALAICAALERRKHRARLQTVELNPAFVTDELLSLMERAGFVAAGVTAESASDDVLQGLGKGYGRAEVVRCAETVRRHRLPVFWMFMLGGPGETGRTARETLQFAEEYIRPGDVAFFNIGVRIYPGTALETRAREEGLLRRPRSLMLDPVVYLSPAVDAVLLTGEVSGVVGRRMHFIDSASLHSPFILPLYRFGAALGVRPPLWRYTSLLRRGLRFFGARV